MQKAQEQEVEKTKICPLCGRTENTNRENCFLDGIKLETRWEINPREQIRLEEKQKKIVDLIKCANQNFLRHWRKIERLHSFLNLIDQKKIPSNPPRLTGFSLLKNQSKIFDFSFFVSIQLGDGREIVLKGKYLRGPREEDLQFDCFPEFNGENDYELLMVREIVYYFICDIWLEKMV